MTRVEKALSANLPPPPMGFKHSVTPDKPAEPAVDPALTADEQVIFDNWRANRVNGTVLPGWDINLPPNLKTAVVAYEAYLATAAFVAWGFVDTASRQMQWRLALVDVAEAVNTAATVPPSFATDGAGMPGPSVDDVVITP